MSIAKLVPNGVLLCFASYGLMNKCIESWESEEKDGETLMKKIETLKPIYREVRTYRNIQLILLAKKTKSTECNNGKISENGQDKRSYIVLCLQRKGQ